MRRVTVSLLVLLAVVSLSPTWSVAQTDETRVKLLLYKLDADGIPDAEKRALFDDVKAGLEKYNKYEIIDGFGVDILDEMVMLECLDIDADCLSKMGQKGGADQVLYSKWSGGKLTLYLVDAKTGKVLQNHVATVAKTDIKTYTLDKGVLAVFGEVPKPKPKPVKLEITSTEPETEVTLNGAIIGKTPVTTEVMPGEYTVILKKAEFLVSEEKIVVEADKPRKLEVTLKPVPKPKVVKLEVTCNEAGADVAINGKNVGKTPFTTDLAPGEYKVTVTKANFLVSEEKVLLEAEKPKKLDVALKAAPKPKGKLVKLEITCNEADAEVTVNGANVGKAPVTTEVAPGEYTILVKKANFLIAEEKVTVEAEKPRKVEITLKPVPKKDPVVTNNDGGTKTGDGKDGKDGKGDGKVEEDPFYTTWWFWTIVGVGVTGIIAGSVAAATSGSDGYDVGGVRLSITPSSAEKDYIFYQ